MAPARVTCQLFGSAKALDGANLGPDHHRQHLTHPRLAVQISRLSTGSKGLWHLAFDGFEIGLHGVEFVEHQAQGLLGVRRQLGGKLFR